MATYNQDFYQWTQDQVVFLEKKEFTKLDVENLIDEVGCLGRNEEGAIENYFSVALTQLLIEKYKIEDKRKRKSREISMYRVISAIEDRLKTSPSLRNKLKEMMDGGYAHARMQAEIETMFPCERFPEECPWSVEQILDKA